MLIDNKIQLFENALCAIVRKSAKIVRFLLLLINPLQVVRTDALLYLLNFDNPFSKKSFKKKKNIIYSCPSICCLRQAQLPAFSLSSRPFAPLHNSINKEGRGRKIDGSTSSPTKH